MKKIHANAVRLGTIGKYAYYPIMMLLHPDIGSRDLLAETLEACHREGYKVIPYFPVAHPLPADWVTKLRPEWLWKERPDRDEPLLCSHFGGKKVAAICLNSPYREAIKSILNEVLNNYDIDGVYFGGPYRGWSHQGICYCKYCQSKFREETGRDLPLRMEGNLTEQDKDMIQFARRWNKKTAADLMEEMVTDIKSKKDLPVLFNYYAAAHAGEEGTRMVQCTDGYLLESRWSISRVGCGSSAGKIVWNYIGVFTPWPRFWTEAERTRNHLLRRQADSDPGEVVLHPRETQARKGDFRLHGGKMRRCSQTYGLRSSLLCPTLIARQSSIEMKAKTMMCIIEASSRL